MTKTQMLRQIEEYEKLAASSILKRFINRPYNYLLAMSYRKLGYHLLKKGLSVNTNTFWGAPLRLTLPSAMDIYITGGKTHNSEIRLCKFLAQYLNTGNCFLDIGANVGFFSLLAAECVGPTGKVLAMEASTETFQLLYQNLESLKNAKPFHLACADESSQIELIEFPVLYNEYNTLESQQYADEVWFKKIRANKILVEAIKGDDFIAQQSIAPHMIKIDVEGAEARVIDGLTNTLTMQTPIVIMEFINSSKNNSAHVQAAQQLLQHGYFCYQIDADSKPLRIESDLNTYMAVKSYDSDNLVFSKKEL